MVSRADEIRSDVRSPIEAGPDPSAEPGWLASAPLWRRGETITDGSPPRSPRPPRRCPGSRIGSAEAHPQRVAAARAGRDQHLGAAGGGDQPERDGAAVQAYGGDGLSERN